MYFFRLGFIEYFRLARVSPGRLTDKDWLS